MSELTIEALRKILRDETGVDEAVTGDGDLLDTRFADLGCDSLGLLEVAVRVQNEYQVRIPDEILTDLDTPRLMIDYVNQHGVRL
jgi:act minimal PKS acyl carrier protein